MREMDRRARREKRASKSATARSRRAKLLLMSGIRANETRRALGQQRNIRKSREEKKYAAAPSASCLLTCYRLHSGIDLVLGLVHVHCHVAFCVGRRGGLLGGFRRGHNYSHAVVAVLCCRLGPLTLASSMSSTIGSRGVLYRVSCQAWWSGPGLGMLHKALDALSDCSRETRRTTCFD